MSQPQYVINPKTNRNIKIGTKAYNKLVKEGLIKLPTEEPKQEVKEEVKEEPRPQEVIMEDEVEQPQEVIMKKEEIQASRILDNLGKLAEMQSEEQVRKSIEMMLLDDYYEENPTKKKQKKGSKHGKWYVESPSSDSESE